MSTRSYHLMELAIARDRADPRHSLPAVLPTHRRVLDIGCGAGQTLIGCELPEGVMGVGVDVDHEALVLGHQIAPALRFLRSRGEMLPFADASFDLVICRVALPYMHIRRATSEMARVLAAGGAVWLVLHPWTMTAAELAAAARSLRLKAMLHRMHVMASSALLHVADAQFKWPFGGGYESFQTARGIRRALTAAGFDAIEIRRGAAFIATARRSHTG